MNRQKSAPYTSPVRYTAAQLLQYEIEDLETDVRCAERDGQPEYAEECRAKLVTLRAKQKDGP